MITPPLKCDRCETTDPTHDIQAAPFDGFYEILCQECCRERARHEYNREPETNPDR